jgi:hypothetical protein
VTLELSPERKVLIRQMKKEHLGRVNNMNCKSMRKCVVWMKEDERQKVKIY